MLDPDLLRTFVCIAEEGSFTRAGQRVGRTQSAVSMQLQRLEAQLGQRLVSRGKGGAVHLTPHGQFLLERARELLALNDQIWSSFKTPPVQGTVRLGTPDDYALRYLPQHPRGSPRATRGAGRRAVPAVARAGRRLRSGRAGPQPRLRGAGAGRLAGGGAVAGAAELDHLHPLRAAPAGSAAAGAGRRALHLASWRRCARSRRRGGATASRTLGDPDRHARARCWPGWR